MYVTYLEKAQIQIETFHKLVINVAMPYYKHGNINRETINKSMIIHKLYIYIEMTPYHFLIHNML